MVTLPTLSEPPETVNKGAVRVTPVSTVMVCPLLPPSMVKVFPAVRLIVSPASALVTTISSVSSILLSCPVSMALFSSAKLLTAVSSARRSSDSNRRDLWRAAALLCAFAC